MPRPLRKPKKLLLSMSDADHAEALHRAGGKPLGPWLVTAALRSQTGGSSNAKAALESWELRWLPELRRSAPMFSQVRAALDLLRKAIG